MTDTLTIRPPAAAESRTGRTAGVVIPIVPAAPAAAGEAAQGATPTRQRRRQAPKGRRVDPAVREAVRALGASC
jgi:hypothetical protein